MDAAIFQALIVAGIIVLSLRKNRSISLLKVNAPILIYFLYCLMSVVWSPIHGPAFKRWIKDVGDLVMVLIIITDLHPIAAMRRLYSRVGFILLPFSIVLIRYTDLGRGYDPDGNPMNTGVTTNKNSLGLIVFLIFLGALWHLRALLRDKEAPNRSRRLVAQGVLLAFCIALLQMAHCATAVACSLLGGGLMLATGLRAVRRQPGRVHAICLGIFLTGALLLFFGGESAVTGALGRKSNLTGRTDIWRAALAAADSPILGTGFESFWNVNVDKVALGLRGYWEIHNLVSAHNGYIEVYLDLGLVGVCLIAAILLSGYWRAGQAFRRNRELGSLMLAYVITLAFYSITEVGFRVLGPSWIFLLLAVVAASGVTTGLISDQRRKTPNLPVEIGNAAPAADEFIPEAQMPYTACQL